MKYFYRVPVVGTGLGADTGGRTSSLHPTLLPSPAHHGGAGVQAELFVPVGDGLADLVVAAVGGVDAGGGRRAALHRVGRVVALKLC